MGGFGSVCFSSTWIVESFVELSLDTSFTPVDMVHGSY